MMCKGKGGCKRGHYDVEIRWMDTEALTFPNYKGRWIKKGIMMWKSNGGCKRRHYVQLKRPDG